MGDKYYITTAITYANSKPHIGHAYEEIATDVLARWRRATGYDVQFVTGSDEHSSNVEARARELNQPPQEYCDRMAEIFQKTWQALNVSYDRFIRTSDKRHHEAAKEIVRRVKAAGDIYPGHYEGWYCNSCENYYIETELKDGLCPTHGIKAVWLSEENYFFRLSRFAGPLLEHIAKHPEFIQPVSRCNEVVNIINSGLKDISVSRASTQWGIPFPDDPEHIIYVWFEALINYLSAIGFPDDMETFNHFWPADIHIIGKDITRFHCIIWPAMLMAAGLELPKQVFGHGFIHLKGEKISKTRGNVLDPLDMVREYGVDPFRYVLLASGNFAGDKDFSEEEMVERYNSDLANDMGNLLNRTLTMVEKYCEGRVPRPPETKDLTVKPDLSTRPGLQWSNPKIWEELVKSTPQDMALRKTAVNLYPIFDQAMEKLDFSGALAIVWNLVKQANKYIEESSPWSLVKQGKKIAGHDYARVNLVMYNLLEVLRLVALYIHPFMPGTTPRILAQLGYPYAPEQKVAFPEEPQWGRLPSGQKIAKAAPLFPRIIVDAEKEKEKKGRNQK